jgi:hypothetical protein
MLLAVAQTVLYVSGLKVVAILLYLFWTVTLKLLLSLLRY